MGWKKKRYNTPDSWFVHLISNHISPQQSTRLYMFVSLYESLDRLMFHNVIVFLIAFQIDCLESDITVF